MESILVYPENEEQLKAVKTALKALKVKFEPLPDLPAHISKSIEKSIQQFENGQTISLEEFKLTHLSC